MVHFLIDSIYNGQKKIDWFMSKQAEDRNTVCKKQNRCISCTTLSNIFHIVIYANKNDKN